MLLVALMVVAATAEAQIARSLDELVRFGTLGPGDGVYVTDAGGRRIKGDVRDLSSSAVAVTDGHEVWTLADTEIETIERQDPLSTGMWIGAGLGVAGFFVGCGLEGGEFCYRTFLTFPLYFTTSIVVGAMIDASRHETVYRASRSARVTASPVLTRGGAGILATLSW